MNRQLRIAVGMLILSILSLILLWKQATILSILYIIYAYTKHRLCPIKKELLWFVFVCLGGAIVEIMLVNISHAWSYSNSQLLGIPLYMPLFWGVVGTTIIVIYNELLNSD